MKVALAETVARVLDPETPVVWLDPTLPSELWDALPAALEQAGFQVAVLENGQRIGDAADLLRRLSHLRGSGETKGYSAAEARRLLAGFVAGAGRGWVLIWRYPEPVRQENESRFEEFVDLIESLHEEGANPAPKLIVAD